jgi:triacylglycerol lipase
MPLMIVFCAGVLLPQRLVGHDYFRGARQTFAQAAFPPVPPVANVETRAKALAAEICAASPAGPIHLIAHSMGGLDARFMLANDLCGLARPGRVLSLSTISTPHHGSLIADLLVGSQPGRFDPRRLVYDAWERIATALGFEVGALRDLTSGFADQFNRRYTDVEHIRYFSYAGSTIQSFLLNPFHQYILGEQGANDGLVSVESARWGTFVEPPWLTDHFGEIGYAINPLPSASSFDHIAALKRIVTRVVGL